MIEKKEGTSAQKSMHTTYLWLEHVSSFIPLNMLKLLIGGVESCPHMCAYVSFLLNI